MEVEVDRGGLSDKPQLYRVTLFPPSTSPPQLARFHLFPTSHPAICFFSFFLSTGFFLDGFVPMAEKRKLPPRAGREPAAKRRVSEAVTATPQSQKKKKKEKAPTPRAPTPPPEPVEAPLPSKLKDGDGIPVTRVHQSATLSENEYQSIAERFETRIQSQFNV